MSTPLTVARIPALVREVDVIVAALGASALPTSPHVVEEVCKTLLMRVGEVDEFCRSLRPGPLQTIVQKQINRLEGIMDRLESSAGTGPATKLATDDAVFVDKSRRRQVVPVSGSLLIKKVATHYVAPGSASKQLMVKLPRNPKPIYRWEKRRPARFTPAHNSSYSPHELIDDDAEEASMELQPSQEPGHYMRSRIPFTMVLESKKPVFEFQIILTEAELQFLKFQRRQVEAERLHLKRQLSKSGSS